MIINGYVTKRIPCPGEYYASECGKIFNGRFMREMKPCLNGRIGNQYYVFLSCEGEVRKWIRFHRAVYESWIGPIPADKVIDHADKDKLNNHISNLRILTTAQNNQHNNCLGYSPTTSGTYIARIHVNGKRYNKTFKTMVAAQAWRAMMKAQLCPHTVV